MKKQDYSVDDLIHEESFQSYVLGLKGEDVIFWEDCLNKQPNLKEKMEQAAKVINAVAIKPEPVDENMMNEDLARLKKSLNGANRAKQIGLSSTIKWSVGIAASILLVIGFQFFQPFLTQPSMDVAGQVLIEKSNPRGRKSIVTLPDGTRVNLNAESSVKYYERRGRREVYLEGEAFFKVKKDVKRPFTVFSGEVSTTALGTAFNVRAYDDDSYTKVYLVTGKVAIEKNISEGSGEKHILLPGHGIVYDKEHSEIIKADMDEEELLAWKDGGLRFVNANMARVAKELERWYGVDIIISGEPKEAWEINGSFKNQSINNVLQSIQYTTAFEYTIEDKIVKINF